MEKTSSFLDFEKNKCCPVCKHGQRSLTVYNPLGDKLPFYELYNALPAGSYADCKVCSERIMVYNEGLLIS